MVRILSYDNNLKYNGSDDDDGDDDDDDDNNKVEEKTVIAKVNHTFSLLSGVSLNALKISSAGG